MKFYLNGKKISRKSAQELAGTERFGRILQEAKEAYREDPGEEIAYMVGGGILVIEF